MFDALIYFDHLVTLGINHLFSPQLDWVMETISRKLTWIPLYGLILFGLIRNFGWRSALVMTLIIGINLLLTDQISVWLKFSFERLRPCHNPYLAELLFTPAGCGGQYGFVSSHAANTMGLAMLVSLIMKSNRWISGMLVFAFLNGYSRIYLGKHFLADVLGGFILGIILAYFTYQLLQFALKKFNLMKHE